MADRRVSTGLVAAVAVLVVAPWGAAALHAGTNEAALHPRTDCRLVWQKLVVVEPHEGVEDGLVARTIGRLMQAATRVPLLTDLGALFYDPATGVASTSIHVHFVTALPNRSDSDGWFEPAAPWSPRYDVYVRVARELPAGTVSLFEEYPGNTSCDVVSYFQRPESIMAQTLFHELLHIWFVSTFWKEKRDFPTGHGDVHRCQFEPEFLARLRAHSVELKRMEDMVATRRRQVRRPQPSSRQ